MAAPNTMLRSIAKAITPPSIIPCALSWYSPQTQSPAMTPHTRPFNNATNISFFRSRVVLASVTCPIAMERTRSVSV